MLTIWDLLALALIALAVAAAITHAISGVVKKLTPSKDITLDAMMARVASIGWHFALSRGGYRIWHANDFANIKREIETSTLDNDVALWLLALGCLKRDETFAGCKPRYVPVDGNDASTRPLGRLNFRADRLYRGWRDGYSLTHFDVRQAITEVFMRSETVFGREAVADNHPAFHALYQFACAYVSGRPVNEAELTELTAALDPERLAA
jgi:hypothetical protein